MVVVHPRDAAGLHPIRPDLPAAAGRRPTDVGVIGDEAGVDERDHHAGVAQRQVPRLERVDILSRGLIEMPGARPQRVVGHRGHRREADGVRLAHLTQPTETRQRVLHARPLGQVHDVERAEVGRAGAHRRRLVAAKLLLEPHPGRSRQQSIQRRHAESCSPLAAERSALEGRAGRGGCELQDQPIGGEHRRDCGHIRSEARRSRRGGDETGNSEPDHHPQRDPLPPGAWEESTRGHPMRAASGGRDPQF